MEMLYRAEFSVNNLKGRLISPVIFGNIAKTYYEILGVEAANIEIKRMIQSNTLISDMITSQQRTSIITKVKENDKALLLKDLYGKTEKEIVNLKYKDRDLSSKLSDKRNIFREYKKASKNIELEIGKETARLRNSIDRYSGNSKDGNLFLHNEFKYLQRDIFNIYISTESKQVLSLIELAFEIMEKTGIGTDTSIGNGVIKFNRYQGSIFVEENSITVSSEDNDGVFTNIASTIICDPVMHINYKDYIVKRYDSYIPEQAKPSYYYMECGSKILGKASAKAFIISNKENFKTYTCIFPVKFRGDEKNE